MLSSAWCLSVSWVIFPARGGDGRGRGRERERLGGGISGGVRLGVGAEKGGGFWLGEERAIYASSTTNQI